MDDDITVQILSDLHFDESLSGYSLQFPVAAPYLALLGDIGNLADGESEKLYRFILEQLHRYKVVFFLLGNHEPFGSSYESCAVALGEFKRRIDLSTGTQTGELVFLDRTRFDISPRLTILGCTLFSAIDSAHESLISYKVKDFTRIEDGKWTVQRHHDAHRHDLSWLNGQVAHLAAHEPHRKIVIFSHYAPTLAPEAFDSKHAGSTLSSIYGTDLSKQPCSTTGQVKIWAFGHTHWNCDFEVDGIRYVSNQRGYESRAAAGFDVSKVVYL